MAIQNVQNARKVVVFIPRFPNPTETFIEREVYALMDCVGTDVHVVSSSRGLLSVDSSYSARVHYAKIRFFDVPLMVLRFLFLMVSRLGVIVPLLSELLRTRTKESAGSLFYSLFRSLGFYYWIVKKMHPDFLLAHFMSLPSTDMLIVAKVLGIPFGISAHARDVTVDGQFIKVKVSNAAFVSICNRHVWNEIRKELPSELADKIKLSYHGLDFTKMAGLKMLDDNKRSDKVVLLNNGRLVEKKGHKDLLQALKILHDRGEKYYLRIIAGGGSLFAEISNLIKSLGLTEYVDIVNEGKPLPFSEIYKYYLSSNVFVFSSINAEGGDVDGIPNVLVEAAYFKLPIVSTDVGSTSELISHNENGLLVPQKNPQAMADAISMAVKSAELRNKLQENAYKTLVSKFDLAKNVLNLQKEILTAVAEHKL